MKYYLLWLIYFIPAHMVGLVSRILAPIVALFVVTEPRTDRVKRLGNKIILMPRDYLWGWLRLFQTHDNAVDEYWFGMYTNDSMFDTVRNWTQDDYDRSRFIRYFCRVAWLIRNAGYGWSYKFFSVPLDKGFQLKGKYPLFGGWHNDYNIGWKSHATFPRKLYAGRILGLRRGEEKWAK